MLGNVACRGHQDGFVPAQGKGELAMGRACGFEPFLLRDKRAGSGRDSL